MGQMLIATSRYKFEKIRKMIVISAVKHKSSQSERDRDKDIGINRREKGERETVHECKVESAELRVTREFGRSWLWLTLNP